MNEAELAALGSILRRIDELEAATSILVDSVDALTDLLGFPLPSLVMQAKKKDEARDGEVSNS